MTLLLRVSPTGLLQHVPQHSQPAVDLGEAGAQRGEPEADAVRLAVVGDDAARPQLVEHGAEAGAPDREVARRGGPASRGETSSTPSGPSQASTSSSANVGHAIDFARTAAIAGLLEQVQRGSSGTMARIGGVPLTSARTPAAGT